MADAETAAALVLAACHSLVATLEILNDQLIRLFDQKLSSICKMLFLLRDQNRHNRPNSHDIPKLLVEIKPASTAFNLSEASITRFTQVLVDGKLTGDPIEVAALQGIGWSFDSQARRRRP